MLKTFTEIINNGSNFINNRNIDAKRFQQRIQKMIFITKQKNENGHQIADLIAYPIAHSVLGREKLNPAFNIVKAKFRHNAAGRIMGYGLKIFPK